MKDFPALTRARELGIPIFLGNKNAFCNEANPYIVVTEMKEEFIAHEVAHYMDFLERGYTEHDRHWADICRSLGGSGAKYIGGEPL